MGRNLKLRHDGRSLGAAWALGPLLVQFGVLVFVFERVIDAGLDDYAAFLLPGLLVWAWFAGGIVHVALVLRRRADGLACLETGLLLPPETRSGRTIECTLRIDRLDVAPGAYAFDAGVWSDDWQTTHDLHLGAYPLDVVGDVHPNAVLAPPMTWTFQSLTEGRAT